MGWKDGIRRALDREQNFGSVFDGDVRSVLTVTDEDGNEIVTERLVRRAELTKPENRDTVSLPGYERHRLTGASRRTAHQNRRSPAKSSFRAQRTMEGQRANDLL